MRIGAKKKPFYRVVAVDERAKRTGSYLELLGTYDPLTKPKDIKLKQDRIDHWVKQGAQLSDGYLRMTGKAPQRPPRKPKKEKKVEQPAATSPQPTDQKAEAAPANTSEVKEGTTEEAKPTEEKKEEVSEEENIPQEEKSES